MRGKHSGLPEQDLLSALGKLRRDLREILGADLLAEHSNTWFDEFIDLATKNLPKPATRIRRKQPPDAARMVFLPKIPCVEPPGASDQVSRGSW